MVKGLEGFMDSNRARAESLTRENEKTLHHCTRGKL